MVASPERILAPLLLTFGKRASEAARVAYPGPLESGSVLARGRDEGIERMARGERAAHSGEEAAQGRERGPRAQEAVTRVDR